MHLAKLDVKDVRNLSELHLECNPGINVITGKNAAGKTAILESIHVLARASSFRTPRISDVIQYGKNNLSVTAQIKDSGNQKIITGIEKSNQQTQIKFNGIRVLKRSEQAQNLPIITITTESHGLLYGSPKERRHWLDWSMFHVEPGYMQDWHDYHHALRQRNALLRTAASNNQYDAWENILAKTAVRLRRARSIYLEQIGGPLSAAINSEIGVVSVKLRSAQEEEPLIKARLEQQRKSDAVVGHTQYGPHRENVLFEVNDREAGKMLSRGEGKLFVMFLLAIQAREYRSRKGRHPVLLVDDLPAELDETARTKIMQILFAPEQQLFITTTSEDLIDIKNMPRSVFHVEHGKLVKVVE